MLIQLTVTARPDRGAADEGPPEVVFRYRFDRDEVLVGRSGSVDVRLPHPAVSLVHLRLRRDHEAGAIQVLDAGSTNGTLINGHPLEPDQPTPLLAGATVEVGPFRLALDGGDAASAQTVPQDTASFARRMALDLAGELAGDAAHPYLEVSNGPDWGRRLPLGPRCGVQTVGRGSDCDLPLSDQDTSRRHMEVRRTRDTLEVRDLGSKNGVKLDGQPTRGWARLAHGCQLQLGQTLLRFVDPTEEYLDQLGQQEPATGPRPGPPAPSRTSPPDRWIALAAAAMVAGTAALIAYLLGWI